MLSKAAHEQPRDVDRSWALLEQIIRTSFVGTGKSKPLRHLGDTVWSRRRTQEHRLVYLVCDERIDLFQGAITMAGIKDSSASRGYGERVRSL